MHFAVALAYLLVVVLDQSCDGATLVPRWSEEFTPCTCTTCVNGGINLDRWTFELGDGRDYGDSLVGWGNWQRQCHTNSSSNARVEPMQSNPMDGMLVIQGNYHPGGVPCHNAVAIDGTAEYTSARLVTRGKAAFRWTGTPGNSTPVRIDVRLKVPLANGTWPAAWMLPDTDRPWCMGCSQYGNGWCLGGELDIMEHVNVRTSVISTVHYGGLPDASWLNCLQKVGAAQLGSTQIRNWVTMSMIWDSTYIRFLANGKLHSELRLGDWFSGGAPPGNPYAPFDAPFYLILDMAIGGQFPGYDIDVARAPFTYMIDYIRVYDVVA